MKYYLVTGKKEYMERGIAALRASWNLQILKEYENMNPGNVKNIDTIDDVDKGSVFENYGHFGKDERIPGYIMFDWGIGTALTATAFVKENFGDLYIDFKEKNIFGIDGVKVSSYEFQKDRVIINLELIQGKSYILVKSRDSPSGKVKIVINDTILIEKQKSELDHGFKYETKLN
ncbi:MAG: hypothetical protein ACFE9Z_10545 [Promethearchaeota archaeon]